jgi:hypothetical protein
VTVVDVRDETGRNRDLAAGIEGVLREAAPLIEDVSGLALPCVTFRLTTAKRWQTAMMDAVSRSLERGFAGGLPSPRERAEAASILTMWRRTTSVTWARFNGAVLATADGQAETVVVPSALHHTGLRAAQQGVQRWAIGHAVRQAQLLASQLATVPPRIYARPYKYDDRAVTALSAGHADWVETNVSPRILGSPLADEITRRSWRFHQQEWLADQFNSYVVLMAKRKGQPMPDRGARTPRTPQPAVTIYEPGVRFVEATITPVGAERWNKVWTDLAMVPTPAEIDEPESWLRRVSF